MEETKKQKEETLQVEFETKIEEKDLMNFKLYHNYHSVSGIATVLFGVIMLVVCIVSIGEVHISYTLMTGFFGLFFTVYTPIGMAVKVKNQMKKVPAFREPVKYTVTAEKILLAQGEVREELLWDDIFKITCTGKSIVLYITAVRANIIPLEALGKNAAAFFEIARQCLRPFQIKVNETKVIAKCNLLVSQRSER